QKRPHLRLLLGQHASVVILGEPVDTRRVVVFNESRWHLSRGSLVMTRLAVGPRPWLAVGLAFACLSALYAQDDMVLPASLTKEQKDNLLRFLKEHGTPTRYVPKGAKIVDAPPPASDVEITATKEKPIKQYTVQITPHRPVPGEEQVTKADVYY